MAEIGMDVDAVEQASRQLKTRAGDIATVVARIDGVVSRLRGQWVGQDARDFIDVAWPQHRKALTAARAAVAGLGQSAWTNAQQQREASTAQGAGLSGQRAGGSATSVGLRAGDIHDLVDDVEGLKVGGVGAWNAVKLITAGAEKIGVEHLGFVGNIDNAMGMVDIAEKLRTHDPSVLLDGVHAVADGLEAQANPVAKLAGLATNFTADAVNIAAHTDFSAESWSSANAWAAKHPMDAVNGVIEAEMNYFPTLAGHFLGLFK